MCYKNRVLTHDTIHSSQEGGKLLLSSTVEHKKVNVSVTSDMSNLRDP